MIQLGFFLYLFLELPFLAFAIGLRSNIAIAVALVIGLAGTILFFLSARNKFFNSIQAEPLSTDRPGMEKFRESLQRLLATRGRERARIDFWVTPEVSPQVHVWVVNPHRIDLVFSYGLIQSIREQELEAILSRAYDVKTIRLENRIYALALWIKQIKGAPSRLQYWIWSFWLYPLERALKIANI